MAQINLTARRRQRSTLLGNAAAICALMLVHKVSAQTFSTLHKFPSQGQGTQPFYGLVLSSNVLYGTTSSELTSTSSVVAGTVFALQTDGSGFTNLHSFPPPDAGTNTSADGDDPTTLILSGNRLYGSTVSGGATGCGTLFALNTDGSDFAVLHALIGASEGREPNDLLLSEGTLYGTAHTGGSYVRGTVFALSTNGTGFRVIHTFTAGSDGGVPVGPMVLSGNTLYGTAGMAPFSSDSGMVFALNVDGTGFRVVYSFPNGSSDGWSPAAGLILSGDTLYGATVLGGNSNSGTVFALKVDGTGFRVLHIFNGSTDGSYPNGCLFLSGHALYGTALSGGSFGWGTVFAVATDRPEFAVLHTFRNADGALPNGGLVLSSQTLFGTVSSGGNSPGSVFGLTLPAPQLSSTAAGANVLLTWPTNLIGYRLQSGPNLGPSASWTTNLPTPAVANGQNIVTDPISGAQRFFRLNN